MTIPMPIIDRIVTVLKRRRWYFLIPFLACLVASVPVILMLPNSYISVGKIGVESQQIPENFVRSTITTVAGERVGMVEARVLTNENIEAVIDRLQLYRQDWDKAPTAKLTEKFKENVWVEVIVDPYASRLGAIAFTVAFEDKDPETARAVASELVEMFMQENINSRTERAAETTEFLERKEQLLEQKTRSIDQQIAQFKQKHRNALPEHLELKVSMLARAEADLRSVGMEITAAKQEQRFLKSRAIPESLSSDSNSLYSNASPQEQLEAKQAELAANSLKYRPDHWDVRRLEAEIQALEAQIAQAGPRTGSRRSGTQGQAQANADAQYHSVSTGLKLLREQEESLRSDIRQLQNEIMEIPLVEIELRRLSDLYRVSMEEFSEIRTKKHEASLAQDLEQEQKAERFILLEPPELPLEPKRPLSKLLGIALMLSLGAGACIVYLAEVLDDRIYGRNMLTSLTGAPPLAVIPYIENARRPLGGLPN